MTTYTLYQTDEDGGKYYKVNGSTIKIVNEDDEEFIFTFPCNLNQISDISSYPTITFNYPHGLDSWKRSGTKHYIKFVGGAVAGNSNIDFTIVNETTITLNLFLT